MAPRGREVNALRTRRFSVETIADLDRSVLVTVQLHSTGKRGPKVQVACVSGSRRRSKDGSITSTAV
jgi:hypothetical protein